jgi:threonine dehydratase
MTEPAPARVPTLDEIRAAARRIRGAAVRTPLLHLRGTEAPEVWIKLENLQPINAFKIRGAAAAVTALPEADRARGVWTVSAGNAGQGVAYAAREAGVPASVLVIESAPETKLARMRELGARLVPASWDICWAAMEAREHPEMEGSFVHPFDDHEFIAGNASIGLEILEDLPGVRTVAAGVGGGGLVTGIGAAVKALVPGNRLPGGDGPGRSQARSLHLSGDRSVRIVGVEPETAAPAALSYERGEPLVFPDWKASFVDGAGGKSLFPRMWVRMREVVDEVVVVTLDEVRDAMRLLADRSRVIAEGAGALSVAAAVTGKLGTEGPVVAVVSGGNVDLATFCELVGRGQPSGSG